jgi:sphingolipid delta-4 desaturase
MREKFNLPASAAMDEGRSHRERRAAILRDQPEVRRLFGPCPETAVLAALVGAGQLGLAWAVAGAPWWLLLALAYAVGAFLTHHLNVAIHECSHNLVFRSTALNKALGIVANLPTVLPSAMVFRHYHLLHHRFLGRPGLDADVPPEWEVALVGRSPLRKLLWILAQPLTYALNPLAVRKPIPIDGWLVANVVAVISVSAAVACWMGPSALAYLALCLYFAVGPHPTGAHILQEHILFGGNEMTASYYGPVNAVSINHGLHVEHHDFPNVAGPRLSRLRRMAPRYYSDRFHHASRLATLWRFVMDPDIGLDSRAVLASGSGS